MAVSILGEAAIRLRPETSGFSEEAEVGIAGPLKEVAGKAAGFFAAAFAAEKVGEFLKDSVAVASDVSESTSKVGVVFGQASQQVLDFAHTAASSMGLSESAALEATGTFGNLLRSLGLTQQASADMSTKFVGLAGDLASFNNTDPAQALDALRSGLTGETEPLKQYGVNLNQAAIQQEAVRLGLAKHGEQLNASAQAQAAYSLILQQTTLAQGDFGRTSAGLANQQRILSAQFTDVKANVGALFLPITTLAIHGITGLLMPALLTSTSYLKDAGAGLSAFGEQLTKAFHGEDATGLLANASGIERAMGVLGNRVGFLGPQFMDAFSGADQALALSYGGLDAFVAKAGMAAGNFSATWQDAWTAFTVGGSNLGASESAVIAFASNVGGAFRATRGSIIADWDSIKAAAGQAVTPSLIQGVTVQFMSLKAGVGTALSGVGDTIKGAFSGVGSSVSDALSGAFGSVGAAGGGITDKIAGLFSSLAPKVVPFITGLVDKILPLVQQIVPVFASIFSTVGGVVGSVIGQIVPLLSSLGPVIGQVIEAVRMVSGIWTTVFMGAIQQLLPVLPMIVGAIGTLVTSVVGALGPVLQTLVPVIGQVAGIVIQLVSAFEQGLIQAIGQLVPILPPLITAVVQIGQAIIGALLQAIQALLPALPPIVSALGLVAQALMGALMGAIQAILPLIPTLVDVFMQIINAVLPPLVSLLPIIANLFATLAPILATLLAQLIAGLAPILPVLVNLAAMLIQLAVAALMPLMPIITILINVLVMLVQALVPIIQVVITVAGAILGAFTSILSVVIGVLTTIINFIIDWDRFLIGIFTSIIGAVTGIFSSIFGVIRSIWGGIFGFVSGIVTQIAGVISGVFSGVGHAISSVFSGVGGAVSDAFGSAVGVVKSAINGVIGIINGAIGFINSKLIDTANKVPFVNIPHIPDIPRLHEGGVFDSGVPAGEGLALLRDNELVVTPEQRATADDLLRSLLGGTLPAGTTTTTNVGGGVTINNHITQLPGESGAALAARTNADTVWNLNNGVTRRVGAAAGAIQ